MSAEEWPALQWTGDEAFACRMTSTGLALLHGSTLAPADTGTRIPAASRFWVSPGTPAPGVRASVVTFTPRTKSKPASVSLWSLPPTPAPIASRSLQSDTCRVEYNSAGTAVLVELSTATSASSYYGDSRLFLFTVDGRVSMAVPQAKEGPIADFAWSPTDQLCFIVIAGRSPPAAQLHTLPTGAPVFSFGTGAFNTVRFQPQGRMVVLGGFGNMSGDLQVWDVAKTRAVSSVFNTPVATAFAWGPDGRTLLAATTRPRLMVDNGWRVWSYRGQLLQHVKMDALFDAAWRPAAVGAPFADRAPSPLPKGSNKSGAGAASNASAAVSGAGGAVATGAGASAAAAGGASMGLTSAPRSKAGAYVPPHLRSASPGTSAVVSLMSEGHQRAGKIGAVDKAAPVKLAQAPVPGLVYVDPPAGKSNKKK